MKKGVGVYLYSLLLVLCESAFALSSKAKEVSAKDNVRDYSYATTDVTKTILGSEFAKLIIDKSFEESEIEFLDNNFSFTYDDLNVGNKGFNFGKLGSSIYIEAFQDEHYIPKYLTYGDGNKVTFEHAHNQIIAQVETQPENFTDAKLVYEYQLKVGADDANEIIHAAYLTAKEQDQIRQEKAIYDEKKAEYDEYCKALAEYEQYVKDYSAYLLQKEAYEKYLIEKAKYDEDILRYNQYVSAMEQYQIDSEKYNQYLEDLAEFNALTGDYEKRLTDYQKNSAIVAHQLEVMEIMYKPFVDGYSSIQYFINGDTVSTVLNNKNDLIVSGIPSSAINKADECTKGMRKILANYGRLRANHATDAEKYAYYIANYSSGDCILKNATALTQCLEKFIRNENVKNFMISRGKLDRYLLLLGELVYFANALNDSDVLMYEEVYGTGSNLEHLTPSYKIYGKTYAEILQSNSLLDVSLQGKRLSSYPVAPEDPGIEMPEKVNQPVQPTHVAQPIEPTVVEEPVNDPNEKTRPEFVPNPGEKSFNYDESLTDLVNDFKSGLITYRDSILDDKIVKIVKEIPLLPEDIENTAVIYNAKGEFHELSFFENGGSPSLKEELPTFEGEVEGFGRLEEWLFDADITEIEADNGNIKVTDEQMSPHLEQYLVKWVYEDGTEYVIPQTIGYQYHLPVLSSGLDLPTKPELLDENGLVVERYEFSHYLIKVPNSEDNIEGLIDCNEIAAIQQNGAVITVTLCFDAIPFYKVSFINNGVLFGQTKSYEVGTKITYRGETPTIPDTDTTKYVFEAWAVNNQVVEMPYVLTKDVEFVAVYSEIARYLITWSIDGTNIYERYCEGDEVVPPETPYKEPTDSDSYYTFTGWNKEIVNATENTTYIACFSKHKIILDATITQDENNIKINSSNINNRCDVTTLFELMKEGRYNIKNLVLNFKNFGIRLSSNQVNYLVNQNITELSIETSTNQSGQTTLRAVAKNNVEEITDLSCTLLLIEPKDLDNLHAYTDAGEIALTKENKNLIFSANFGTQITIKICYSISFDSASSVTFYLNDEKINDYFPKIFEKGETVKISAVAKDGLEVSNIFAVKAKTGEVINIDNGMLKLDSADVTIYANTTRKIWKITFWVDDYIIKQLNIRDGSAIYAPENVVKQSDENFDYIFIGWDQEIPTYATQNLEFHAVFDAIEKKIDIEDKKETKLGIIQTISICALSALGVGFIIITVLVIGKPIKKE